MQTNLATPVIAGNWKMFKGPDAARSFCREFAQVAPAGPRTVILFPPAISLTVVRAALSEHGVHVGVQNIHWESQGAFTGETSPAMAREAGAEFALVGHSERRHVFGETDDETARKVAAARNAGLVPVLCVGETIEERRAGRLEEVILRQLDAGLRELGDADFAHLLIAYEPVWAIGTGRDRNPRRRGRGPRPPPGPPAGARRRRVPPPSPSSTAARSSPTTPPSSWPPTMWTASWWAGPASTPATSPRSRRRDGARGAPGRADRG
jgi:triosephosphate isomerase (TIM)